MVIVMVAAVFANVPTSLESPAGTEAATSEAKRELTFPYRANMRCDFHSRNSLENNDAKHAQMYADIF